MAWRKDKADQRKEEGTAPRGLAHESRKQMVYELCELIKVEQAPWQKPWQPGTSVMPYNPVSKTIYKGYNRLLLSMCGYGDPRWLSFLQASQKGWMIKTGSQAQAIEFWQWSSKRKILDRHGMPVLDTKGKPIEQEINHARPWFKRFFVFNGTQLEMPDGKPIPGANPIPVTWEPQKAAEELITASGARIVHDREDRCFYDLSSDSISLPQKGQFPSAANYYGTLLHELAHWTRHPNRLNREKTMVGKSYAREELLAEITSWMLCQDLGLEFTPDNHVSYVQHWIKDLSDDPAEIVRACTEAEKIKDFLLAPVPHLRYKPVVGPEPTPAPAQETAPVKKRTKVRSRATAAFDRPVVKAPEVLSDIPRMVELDDDEPGLGAVTFSLLTVLEEPEEEPIENPGPSFHIPPDRSGGDDSGPAPAPLAAAAGMVLVAQNNLNDNAFAPKYTDKEKAKIMNDWLGPDFERKRYKPSIAATEINRYGHIEDPVAVGPADVVPSSNSSEPGAAMAAPALDENASSEDVAEAGKTEEVSKIKTLAQAMALQDLFRTPDGQRHPVMPGKEHSDPDWYELHQTPEDVHGPFEEERVKDDELRLLTLNKIITTLSRPGLSLSGTGRWEKVRNICTESLGTSWSGDEHYSQFLREAKRVSEYQIGLCLKVFSGELVMDWLRREVSSNNSLLLIIDAGRQLEYPGYLFPRNKPDAKPYDYVPLIAVKEGEEARTLLTLAGQDFKNFRVAEYWEPAVGFAVMKRWTNELVTVFKDEQNADDFAWSLSRPDTPMLRRFQDQEFMAQFAKRISIKDGLPKNNLPADSDMAELNQKLLERSRLRREEGLEPDGPIITNDKPVFQPFMPAGGQKPVPAPKEPEPEPISIPTRPFSPR
jgi:antirestriction protein ArdC